ncbi:hypothetical protein [Parasegetibacter sp. NRK P23]|uniref:hypothetical protein n=1 Tax=Parasegetibacter sp. NRK P23 TaxID=2942999 RepID=UPI002044356C|nr:hypothetical protein [Parasegetibacter sp. NRK P23]MCM5528002.1 hypothetical protein [Parasegetibacter sp. NRK P23]
MKLQKTCTITGSKGIDRCPFSGVVQGSSIHKNFISLIATAIRTHENNLLEKGQSALARHQPPHMLSTGGLTP